MLTPGCGYFTVIKVEASKQMQSIRSGNPNFYFSYYYFTGPGVRLDF